MFKHFILGDVSGFKEAWLLIKMHIKYKSMKIKKEK